jgi:hypothetical protein
LNTVGVAGGLFTSTTQRETSLRLVCYDEAIEQHSNSASPRRRHDDESARV